MIEIYQITNLNNYNQSPYDFSLTIRYIDVFYYTKFEYFQFYARF